MVIFNTGKTMIKRAEDVNQFRAYGNNKFRKHRNRKSHNQYFTPEFAAEKSLSLVTETKIENIIDPAVGNGVFIKEASKKWAKTNIFGIDIDKAVIYELNKSDMPNSYFACGDSILQETWQIPEIQKVLSKGGFDLVIGNPPFSSRYHRVESKEILSNYELAKLNGNLKRSQAVEILFLEIFLKLSKDGGFIIIVLPDGILSNPQYKYVREFILKKTKVLQIINLPRNIFEETSAKTSILILNKQKEINLNYLAQLHDLEKNGKVNNTIKVSAKDLLNRMDYFYFYNLQKSSLQELINNGIVFKQLKDFVVYCKQGKTVYGAERKFTKRGLRFLHSTNIAEIGINYKKDEKFIKSKSNMDSERAHAKKGDILIVRVGDKCVGRTAIVNSKKDIGIVSDCIFMIKVKNISPYFVTIFLKTKFGKDWIKLQKHGSATTCVSQSEILAMPVPLLNKKTQQIVEKAYDKILDDYRIALNSKQDTNHILEELNLLIQFVEKNIE